MNTNESNHDEVSRATAIFAMIVLGGLLVVPISFVLYGASCAIGGLMILGLLIVCQVTVFAIAQLLLGGAVLAGSRIYRLLFRRTM